jgi:hypothetical protein
MKLVLPKSTYVYLGWAVYNQVLPWGKRPDVALRAGRVAA